MDNNVAMPGTATPSPNSAPTTPEGDPPVTSLGTLASNNVPDHSDLVNQLNNLGPAQQQQGQPQAAAPQQNSTQPNDIVSALNQLNVSPQSPGQQQQTPGFDTDPTKNWYMQKVEQFNNGFDNYALGSLKRISAGADSITSKFQGVENIANSMGGLPATPSKPSPVSNAIDNVLAQKTANYNQDWKDDSGVGSYIASGLGKIAAPVAFGSLAAPAIPEAVGGLGTSAATGGLLGYVEPSNSGAETAANTVGGALFGGAAHTAAELGGPMLGKLFTPGSKAADDIANTVGSDPNALAKLQEANNAANTIKAATGQDANLSAGSVFPETQGLKEGALKTDAATQNDLNAKLLQQSNDTKGNILDTIKNMGDAPMDQATMSQAYKALNKEYITPNGAITADPAQAGLPSTLTNHQYANDYLSAIKNGKSDTYKAIPANSLGQLQAAKAAINTRLYSSGSDLANDEKLGLNEALNKINPILQQSDNYNTANSLSQKANIQSTYTDKLGKLSLDNASLKDINKVLFKGDDAKAQFLSDVAKTGGNPDLAKATMYMSDKLANSPLLKILKTKAADAPQTKFGSLGTVALDKGQHMFNARYSKAVLDMTLNQSKWAPAIQSALSQGSASARTAAFANVVHNVMFPAVASQKAHDVINHASRMMQDEQ